MKSSGIIMLQEGGPLPEPESGFLSSTQKWIVQGDTHHSCWQSKRFYWEGGAHPRWMPVRRLPGGGVSFWPFLKSFG